MFLLPLTISLPMQILADNKLMSIFLWKRVWHIMQNLWDKFVKEYLYTRKIFHVAF